MRTQLNQQSKAAAPHRNARWSSLTFRANGPPASRQIVDDAGKGEAAADAQSKKAVERLLRDAVLIYLSDLYTYARFLGLDPAEAEDAVHECFLKALLNVDDFGAATAKLWLIQLLRTICLREINICGDVTPSDNDPEFSACHANDRTAAEPIKLSSLRTEADVRAQIEALPLFLRETLVLRECINLSYSDIAAITGGSTLAVNERLSKARAILIYRGTATQRSEN